MNELLLRHPSETSVYAKSWVVSAVIHGLAVAFAVMLLSDLQLVPEAEPFKWNVAMVDRPVQKQVATPSEAKPVRPAPARPLVKTVQAVQTVQPVVSQAAREVEPVLQAIDQPSQTVHPVLSQAAREVEPVLQAIDQPTPVLQASETRSVVAQAEVTQKAPAAEPLIRQVSTAVQTTRVIERVPIMERSVRSRPQTQADYGWLTESLWRRIEQHKHYPMLAKTNHWEGRVVLEIVIRDDGTIVDLHVAESSGHSVLDQSAVTVVRKASPLALKHPLGRAQVSILVPISYKLDG